MTASVAGARERLEIVTDTERLAEVGPAWTKLWETAGDLIFQSHAWVSRGWQSAPDRHDRQLRIGLLWIDDELQAVLALATHRRRGLTILEWAGVNHTDYCDILKSDVCDAAALERLWRHLHGHGGFDVAFLAHLRPGAAALALSGAGFSHLRRNRRIELSHRITGWADGQAWFNGLSKKARQNYRRSWKSLEEQGPVDFHLFTPDEPVEPVLERLMVLKRNWLEAQGLSSTLFMQDMTALRALVGVLADAGMLRLFVLRCGDDLAAISVNFVQNGTMMAFLTSFDPAFERGSPGTLLIQEYTRWSFDHGLTTVDLLCGAEAFKTRLATDATSLTTLSAAGSLKGLLALAMDGTRHSMQKARRQFGRRSADVPAPTDEADAKAA